MFLRLIVFRHYRINQKKIGKFGSLDVGWLDGYVRRMYEKNSFEVGGVPPRVKILYYMEERGHRARRDIKN